MPAAITLHDIDDDLYAALRENAARAGTSLNRAAKALLASALGLVHRKRPDHVAEFAALAGTITAEDAAALRRAVAAQRTIDEELWK